MFKVVHLTSVHARHDTRIFLKECRSLARAGYQVALVVADGKGDEVKERVAIFDVGASRGRVGRMLKVTRLIFDKAKALDANIYHFHDPELIPAGLRLKRLGKKVVFDSHEDVPKQLLDKHYLNKLAKWGLSEMYAAYEARTCKRFDAIITATPYIRDKFLAINPNSFDINNFPMCCELVPVSKDWSTKNNQVCYVGGIATTRGIKEIVKATELVGRGARLLLVGKFSEFDVEREVKKYSGWANVDEFGWLDRAGVSEVLGRSVAGLVTFHPLPNHIDAQPNKMFEYMSAGVPVIASNFPLWREIVEGNDCGLCVDPLDPKAIAAAIDFMINNPERAKQMGENGQHAVQERYNWSIEESKLLDFYQNLAG